MKNITFYEKTNLLLKSKRPRKPSACVYRHRPAHATGVSEIYDRRVLCINVKVWNESYIIWELFQTPIFSIYKAIHGTFSRHRKF